MLGEFRLTFDDKLATAVNSPRLQSLLAFLVLHRDAPQSRQRIAFMLWPDSSETQARANLRNLFYALRQALPHPDRYISSDALTLQWRSDSPFTLDVLEAVGRLAETLLQTSPDLRIWRGHQEQAAGMVFATLKFIKLFSRVKL